MTEIRAANPAKRGDAVVIELSHSSTAMHGPTTRTFTYAVAVVTSVTRDGYVKTAQRDPTAAPMPWTFTEIDRRWMVPKPALAGLSPNKLIASVYAGRTTDFGSIDEARDAIKAAVQRAVNQPRGAA